MQRPALVCALLALAVLVVYLPVTSFDFINYDDPYYVYDNPQVRGGLTWQGVLWAVTEAHAANWHPLTWLSHMLDCQLFGLNPGWHHLTNVLFHTANSILLFLWLRSLTQAFWRAAFVAALFALHPLHVESVAWISERKDVLSTFFGILSLWAYTNYARTQPASHAQRSASKRRCYWLALGLFALGLMSKPMLVTWPCLMLVLDFWPLQRFQSLNLSSQWPVLRRLFLEKLPFFALSASSCVVTVFAQKAGGAVAPLDDIPLGMRTINALVAYAQYLWHLVWPERMAVLYPYTGNWPLMHVAGALTVLLGITALAWWQRRKQPYLLAGWAWYVGTLVPVIGLVQVGNQSMADRYTYIPAIGLFVALAWAGAELASARSAARWPTLAGAAGVLAACIFTSQAQVLHWHNTPTLFHHTLAVTKNNYVAANDLGFYYADQRAPELAKHYYRLALRMNPKYQHAYNNLGCALIDEGRLTEAKTNLQAALKLDPLLADAYSNLGTVCFRLGENNEAIDHYREALRLRPNYALAHHNLANVLAAKDQIPEAERHYREALRLNRFSVNAHMDMALMLAKVGRFDEAAAQYHEALALQPDSRRAHYELGDMLAKQGKLDDAAQQFSELLQLKPEDFLARYRLATVRGAQGRAAEAITLYREVARRQPDFAEALNNLAWLLAAHPDPQIRNGREAVEMAERACRLTESKEPIMIGTLAAAYAEAGRFPEAIATAERARRLAEENHLPGVAAKNLQLLELYRAGQPCRDIPGK